MKKPMKNVLDNALHIYGGIHFYLPVTSVITYICCVHIHVLPNTKKMHQNLFFTLLFFGSLITLHFTWQSLEDI